MSQEFARDFKGIWIPREIWFDNRLSFFEKLLLAEIDSLDGKDHCFASNKYFVDFFGVNLRTIQNGLSHLKSLGFISEVSYDGRTRILKSNSGKTTHEKFDTSDMNEKTTHEKFDTSDVKIFTPPPYIYNKEYNKENPPLTPPKDKVDKATKEEEEEIQRRFKERPKGSEKIKSRKHWDEAVLKEIRLEKVNGKQNEDIKAKHAKEAQKYDMQKINGFTVVALKDTVEFTQGSYFKDVPYDVCDEIWDSLVLWNKR